MEEAIQTEIIKLLTTNKKFVKIFRNQISKDHFLPVYGDIISIWKKYFSKFKKIPTTKSIRKIADSNIKDNDRLEEIIEALDKIESYEFVDDIDVIFEQAKSYIEKQRVIEALMTCTDIIQDKKQELDFNVIKKMMKGCEVHLREKEQIKTAEDYFKDFHNWLKSDQETINTGYEWLDKVMAGGWHNNTVNVFCSEANCGKTQFLLSLAYQLSSGGKNGLFVSYELDKNQIYKRFYACAAEVPIYDLKSEIMKVNKASKLKGKLSLEHLPDGSNTILLEELIDEYTSEIDPNIDFIVVDYIGCMTSESVDSKSGLYERFGGVISDLKLLADKYGIPILTAHQLNRDGYGNKNVGMNNIGDSMKIAHKADNVFFMQKKLDDDTGTVRIVELKLDKSRVSGYNGDRHLFKFNKIKQRVYEKVEEEYLSQIAEESSNGKKY